MRKPSLLTLTVVILMAAMIILSGHHNPPLPPEGAWPTRHVNPMRPKAPRPQLASAGPVVGQPAAATIPA